MLHPEGGMHKISLTRVNLISRYLNSYPPHPTLPSLETSLVIVSVRLTQIENKQRGRVEIWQMPCTHHPKAVVVRGPSWQEIWKLSAFDVPVCSVHDVCS